jgi:hypothetical protein
VFDGLAIYAALKEHSGQVGVVVDGLAASAASFIAMAAAPGRLEMQPNGTMMIHDAWGACVGGEADMRATADVLGQQTGNIASIYAERGGRTEAEYRELMAAETWAVGQKAVDLGLADRVRRPASGGTPPAAAAVPVAASSPWQVTILAAAVLAKAMPVHHTATVDTAWDGPAAVAAMPNDDTVLEYCHAWQSPEAAAAPHKEGDDDADDRKSNYKFPHHERKGGPANLAACRNGLARLSGVDIPDGDRAGVKAHLQAHLDDGSDETSDRAEMPAWLMKAVSAKEAANR